MANARVQHAWVWAKRMLEASCRNIVVALAASDIGLIVTLC